MFIKSKLFRAISLAALVLSLAVFSFADTIKLKDGSIIKGKIVSFTKGQFVILVGDGTRQRKLNFFADEIESIHFESVGNPAEVINTSARTQTPKKPSYTKTQNGDDTIITIGSAPPNKQPEKISAPKETPRKYD